MERELVVTSQLPIRLIFANRLGQLHSATTQDGQRSNRSKCRQRFKVPCPLSFRRSDRREPDCFNPGRHGDVQDPFWRNKRRRREANSDHTVAVGVHASLVFAHLAIGLHTNASLRRLEQHSAEAVPDSLHDVAKGIQLSFTNGHRFCLR